jgi:uncharacterized repeat protein (TIGR02543 family)
MGIANVTLYARWTALAHTVSYDGNTSSAGTTPNDGGSYTEGQTVIVLGNTGSLRKSGYYFAGWNTASGGGGTSYAPGASYFMGTADVTLYAQWTQNLNTALQGVGMSMRVMTIIPSARTASYRGMFLTAYGMSETEVTQGDYQAVRGVNPNTGSPYGVGPAYPVTYISWFDMARFCNALSKLCGMLPVYDEVTWAADFGKDGFYLPTEAQWEYAAGGPNHTTWSLGNTFIAADYVYNRYPTGSLPVKSRLANGFGLYDMSGNSWEWCHDWYASSGYPWTGQTDPNGPASGSDSPSRRVLRGGAWDNNESTSLRCDFRARIDPAVATNANSGFRVAVGGHSLWGSGSYSVTYSGNGSTGGTAPTDPFLYSQGQTATVLGNLGPFVKAGYNFSGWNTAANGSGTLYAPGATLSIGTTNVTLYATWASAILTVAGNGTPGYGGEGGPATSAQLNYIQSVAVDSSGNIYIVNQGNNRVLKVDTSGTISRFAGTGAGGYSGDGGLASSAQLNGPWGVAVDSSGNVYIAEQGNHIIRKVNTSGIISTVVGTGTAGYSGDNGPATSAMLDNPHDVFVDSSGNLYIADFNNYRIRKVSAP